MRDRRPTIADTTYNRNRSSIDIKKRTLIQQSLRLTRSTRIGLLAIILSTCLIGCIYYAVSLEGHKSAIDFSNPSKHILDNRGYILTSEKDIVKGGRDPKNSLWNIQLDKRLRRNMSATLVDYSSIIQMNNNEQENNVFKSANIFASTVPDTILKLRSAVIVEEKRIAVMDVSFSCLLQID
jgi:hypothetical protein